MTASALEGEVWSEQATTPSAIAEALRELLRASHAQRDCFVPARVLNLVVIADREWRGEIQNRLERVGRHHASRTILCAVEAGRKAIDVRATVSAPHSECGSRAIVVGQEEIVLDIGPRHLEHLASIVDPLVVTDLATLVWSPHGHPEAVDALLGLAQVVLVDSVNEPDPAQAVRRADQLAERAYIVDLAWLRSMPWRERVAATFDPPERRGDLSKISAVTVRHSPNSVIAGLLFLGWMAGRLGWRPGPMASHQSALQGTARAHRQEVRMRLEPDATMSTPGFAGLTVETASGMSVSLDRGPGGLSACRTDRKGREWRWTVMGASRGEAGILGEGIRQALLRDKSYGPALAAVRSMVAG